ncbi:hypothetical protein ACFQRB_15155 [Halobaculum litoreum]|uniref:Uncharacterized protein n=1 Tax=Halobaculum litoreum TaxID=3031998 RepID=A0ABD5XQP8_9EURY|nr:hypothetical protein [Halobaculum sp. DT92]
MARDDAEGALDRVVDAGDPHGHRERPSGVDVVVRGLHGRRVRDGAREPEVDVHRLALVV